MNLRSDPLKVDAPESTYEGQFDLPLAARVRRPAGVVGTGTLALTKHGLRVTGQRVATSWISFAGVFGVLVVPVIATCAGYPILAGRDLHITSAGEVILGLGGAVAMAAMFLVRRVLKPRALRVRLWWSEVASVEIVDATVSFRSAGKPRGWIYFTVADAALAASLAVDLGARAARSGPRFLRSDTDARA